MRPIGVWSKRRRRAALALGLLAILAASRAAEAEEILPNKLALVGLLKSGRFESLEAMIVGYQERFEADQAAQWPAVVAFEAFANSDSALEPRLSDWIALMPDSYAAPLARGVFYDHLGWLSRGCNCAAAATPEHRPDETRDFFALAKPDIERALSLNPHLVAAYRTLADIATAVGDGSQVEHVLTAGLEQTPDADALPQSFLFGLQPKRLGAPDDIHRYLTVLKEHSASVAAHGWFQGYDEFEQGGRLLGAGKYKEALARFDGALGFAGDNPGFMSARADALFGLGRYDEAVATIERALARSPQAGGLHAQLGKVRYYQHRGAESLASLNKAIALDRLNPQYLHWRALTLEFLGRHDEAVRDLDAAVTYGADDATIQAERSRALTRVEGRLDDAVASARRVTELVPESSIAWLRYADALFAKQDCKAQEALQVFHRLCQRDGRCEVEQQDVTPAMISAMECHKTEAAESR